jgi:hypothetical protein
MAAPDCFYPFNAITSQTFMAWGAKNGTTINSANIVQGTQQITGPTGQLPQDMWVFPFTVSTKGKYTLVLDYGGSSPATFNFAIGLTPFYQTQWFAAVVGGVVGLVIGLCTRLLF